MPYRKGQKWIAQVREGDRRAQKLFPSKKEAQDWESDQRQAGSENWRTHSGSLGELANEYLKYSQGKHSRKTFEEKRALFKRLFRDIDEHKSAGRLQPDEVLNYLQEQAKRRSGYSANKDRKNLLAFVSWTDRFKGIQILAIRRSERFPETRQSRYIPPEEDFWRVHDVSVGQDRTMLLAYLHLAARRNELFRLTWDDVDFGSQTVRLTTRKRKDGSMGQDYLPMTKDLFNALSAHRAFVGGDLVFPGPGGKPYLYRIHVMARLCKAARVRKFGFHAIRHLSASILAESGVPAFHIQQVLRHKNLGTTERYLHRLTDIRESMETAFSKPQPTTVRNETALEGYKNAKS